MSFSRLFACLCCKEELDGYRKLNSGETELTEVSAELKTYCEDLHSRVEDMQGVSTLEKKAEMLGAGGQKMPFGKLVEKIEKLANKISKNAEMPASATAGAGRAIGLIKHGYNKPKRSEADYSAIAGAAQELIGDLGFGRSFKFKI